MGESRSRVMVFGHCVVVYGTLEDGVLLAEMGGLGVLGAGGDVIPSFFC